MGKVFDSAAVVDNGGLAVFVNDAAGDSDSGKDWETIWKGAYLAYSNEGRNELGEEDY